MKLIPLTQGKFAQVDDEDYEFLMQWKWHAMHDKERGCYIAGRNHYDGGCQKTIRMHRFILNETNKDIEIDHADHDTLNNQRYNIRTSTGSKNCYNRVKRKMCLTEFKGVHITKEGDYMARIGFNRTRSYIGRFKSAIEAAWAYDFCAYELHEEFALLNFPIS